MATLDKAKRIVVKIGSALLVDLNSGALRQQWLASLAQDIAWLRAKGIDVVIVSSGSATPDETEESRTFSILSTNL